jgi:hypothetical protein
MYKPQFTKHKFPYVAEDGQITDGTTPYYIYICANKECKWCGTVNRWVGKDNNHNVLCVWKDDGSDCKSKRN